MKTTKIVQRFGNGGHVVLPKEYVGRKVTFLTEAKTVEDIRNEVMNMLRPHFADILGVYLYGSYARNEQTPQSDIDILVVTQKKVIITDTKENYSIITVTREEIESVSQHNAVLLLPLLKEAKTIINPDLLKRYKQHTFTKHNTKKFLESTHNIVALNKKGLSLDFEIGSLVYSLILRIRALLMIKLIVAGKQYSTSLLFHQLEKNRVPRRKIDELYTIYSNERAGNEIKESTIILQSDIRKLITIAEQLLKEVRGAL